MKPYELDAEVAKWVMNFGNSVEHMNGYFVIDGAYRRAVPSYSSHIHAAFEVVEEMRLKGYEFILFSDWCYKGTWAAKFIQHGGLCFYCEAESASEAICKAALEAVKGSAP